MSVALALSVQLLMATPVSPAPKHLSLLFVGNSHTGNHKVYEQVAGLLTTRDLSVSAQYISVGMLQDAVQRSDIERTITGYKWGAVILQGAGLSSSHKYVHPQDGALRLARAARGAGLKTYFYAEFSRRGWDEQGYILGIYRGIAQPTGAEIVAVGRAWNLLRERRPGLDLWESDGNHANALGAYASACALAFALGEPTHQPPRGLDVGLAKLAFEAARDASKLGG